MPAFDKSPERLIAEARARMGHVVVYIETITNEQYLARTGALRDAFASVGYEFPDMPGPTADGTVWDYGRWTAWRETLTKPALAMIRANNVHGYDMRVLRIGDKWLVSILPLFALPRIH